MEHPCSHCECPIPRSASRCPHCGLPGLFPNVKDAQEPIEKEALIARYKEVAATAAANGLSNELEILRGLLESTSVVVARRLNEALRLANDDNELYSTFYQQTESSSRIPKDSVWDILRTCADEVLFPGYKREIRFGSFSVNDLGIPRYGDCYLVLDDKKIEHRTTAFEENSSVFMKRHNVSLAQLTDLPRGFRAEWNCRSLLGLAKIASRLKPGMTKAEMQLLILNGGESDEEDCFIEAHIFGSFTRRSLRTLVIAGTYKPRSVVAALKNKLEPIGVEVKVQ